MRDFYDYHKNHLGVFSRLFLLYSAFCFLHRKTTTKWEIELNFGINKLNSLIDVEYFFRSSNNSHNNSSNNSSNNSHNDDRRRRP